MAEATILIPFKIMQNLFNWCKMSKSNKYQPGDWYRVYPILITLIVWKWTDNIIKKTKQILF